MTAHARRWGAGAGRRTLDRLPPRDRARLAAALAGGASTHRAASLVGAPQSVVHAWARRLGIALRPATRTVIGRRRRRTHVDRAC